MMELPPETEAVSMSPLSIAEFHNPIENPPWEAEGLTPDMVLDFCDFATYDKIYHKPLPEAFQENPIHHALRIAWLMKNFPEDAIHFDAEDSQRGGWGISDGNHRLYTALILEREDINVVFSGFEETISEMFGEEVGVKVFDDDPCNLAM